MLASFPIIGRIASREFENYIRMWVKRHFIFKTEKLLRRVMHSKIILILQKGRYLFILFCKCVFIARDKLPGYGRAINNSFFSTSNATGVCKNFLFKKVLAQLSTSLMENTFFLYISFKWLNSNEWLSSTCFL